MKKTIRILVLMLCIAAMAGCNKNTTDSGITPTPTGTSAEVAPDTGSESQEPLPTPTPEGNYVGFSLDSGFYDKTQTVSLTCNVADAKIYYTLDGSTPDTSSTLYKTPITVSRKLYTQNVLAAQTDISVSNNYIPDFPVDKCTVIRAVAYLPDGTTTPLAHASYFIGLDRDKFGNVPVISLVTDFDNLYDYETGIYVLGKTHDEWLAEDPSRAYLDGWQHTGNYSNRGREWERPVSVELITADGSAGFKQNMGLRIMGGASRNQAQKSLKLYAREEYGAKNLNYALIPNNYDNNGELITKYKTFVLRVGGNDADFARLRDPYLQTLVKDARFETQQATPCIVFLNGEYWGMYTINEDYTDNHIQNNYGVDNKNVILIKRGELEEGEESDLTLYQDMYQFITKNDMSNEANYAKACELVDIGSFADYFAFQLYIYNEDGFYQDNNWRMWRVRTADNATSYSDGRWRFAAYDNDYSTGIYSGADSASYDNITQAVTQVSDGEREDNIERYRPVELLRSLLKNDSFREEFILALCDMRNIYFEPKLATQILIEMAEPYLELMPDTWKRFGPDWIANGDPAGHINGKILDLRNFIAKRYVAVPNIVKKSFGLESAVKLTINASNPTMGTLLVNGRELDSSFDFGGMYFPGLTITVTAVPADGYKFAGWNVKKGEFADTTSATLTFTMDSAVTLEALFEEK